MQVKKQQLEPDMEQSTGSKLEEYNKAVYCHPAYLTYMQGTSWTVAHQAPLSMDFPGKNTGVGYDFFL